MRFHRPPSGIGLNENAQATIKMVRKIENHIKMWEVEAHQELLSERESDEAYLAADPGKAYILYFTDGGSVQLDLSHARGALLLRWINVQTGDWEYDLPIDGGGITKISAPATGGWMAVIL